MKTLLLAPACVMVAAFQIVDTPGTYRTAGARMCVKFFYGEAEAGNLQLVPGPSRKPFQEGIPRALDATAFAWLNDWQIIFSSSPIYGEGGLWLFDLRTNKVDEVVPPGRPSELEYLWTKLISVDANSLTCWVADIDRLDLSRLEQTAERKSFRWTLRPRPLRPHN